MTISREKRSQLGSVSAVISFLLTGAFILQTFDIQPILSTSFTLMFGDDAKPAYFNIALGAIGAYAVIYQILYSFFLSPLECLTKNELTINTNVDIRSFDKTDIFNLIFIFLIYDYLLTNLGNTDPNALMGGFLIIMTSFVFRLIPRMVAQRVEYDCFWTIKVIAISIPVSVIVYIPTIAMIHTWG